MAIKIPQKVIDQIKQEIIASLEKRKVRFDQSDIDDIVNQVKSRVETPVLDSQEVVRGLLEHVTTTEDEKRVDFYRGEIFSPDIKQEIGKKVLDQIEIPKDGDKGEKGDKGEPGKDPQPIPLTDRDKKEIAGFVDVTKLIKDRKKDLVLLIEQLKTGKIRLPSHAGIDVKEIIAEINKILGTSDWQNGNPGSGSIGHNVAWVNFTEGFSGSVPDEAGVVKWNDNELALDVKTGIGPTLQVGQEIYILICNETGSQIDNFTPLRPLSATVKNGLIIPTVELAKADEFATVEGTLMVSTMDIPNNTIGLATRFGRVRDADTSAFNEGDGLFVSATTAGEFVNVAPPFPNYAISMGGVLKADAVEGEFIVSVTRDIFDTTINFWNGVFRETISFEISSNGVTVTGILQPDNGHPDMTMMFSDGFSMLDTTPPVTIELIPGTANNPQENFIYVPKSTKVLTVSTSAWPTDEHIKVANTILRTAAITQADGELANRNWNDHIESTTTFQGHMSHICEKLRQFEAQWDSGVEGSATIDSGPTPDDVFVANTAGFVYQLHKHPFPALDTQVDDDVHIVNHFVNPFLTVMNLNGQTSDSLGVTLVNSSFSFVMWGIQNRAGCPSHLMINLPTGKYAKSSPSSAVSDAFNFSVYDIENKFQGFAFLIARFTFTLDAPGQVWTLFDTEDLRGKIPNTTAGGGAGGTGVTTWTGLSDTPNTYVGEGVPRANTSGTALDFTTLLKSGSDQSNAGAAAGEFWRTSGHATLPDNVILQGV